MPSPLTVSASASNNGRRSEVSPRVRNGAVATNRTIRSVGHLSPRRRSTARGAVATLAERTGFFLFVYSPETRALLSWSDNAKTILGVKDIAIARDANLFLRYVHPEDRFVHLNALEAALAGTAPYRATYRWLRPDTDELRWLHCRADLVERDGERLFEGAILDLSTELASAGALRGAPDSLEAVAAALPFTLITLDRDLRIVRQKLADPPLDFGDPGFGRAALTPGRNLLDGFTDSNARERCRTACAAVLEGRSTREVATYPRPGGSTTIELTPLEEHGATVGLILTARDTTPVTQLEERLAEVERAAGLRTLTASVVHNLNNSLQRIIGQTALITAHPERVDIVTAAGHTIVDIITRASELSHQLCRAEGTPAASLVPVDLNVATLTAINRFKELFSTAVTIGVQFGHVAPILGRHEPLVEAIEGLIRAARRSIGPAGTLTIRTGEASNTEQPHLLEAQLVITTERAAESTPPEAPPIVSPNGGVSAAAATTITTFGGTVREHSALPTRRTLTLTFPVTTPAAPPPLDEASGDPPDILVVDDDRMVLDTVGAILRSLGFRPVVTSDGQAVADIVRRHGASLRIALVDALMPQIDGAAVIKLLTSIAPGVIPIGFSGAPTHITAELEAAGAVTVLRKPIDPTTLRDTVTRLLAPASRTRRTSATD